MTVLRESKGEVVETVGKAQLRIRDLTRMHYFLVPRLSPLIGHGRHHATAERTVGALIKLLDQGTEPAEEMLGEVLELRKSFESEYYD